jgi:hypothetical protein
MAVPNRLARDVVASDEFLVPMNTILPYLEWTWFWQGRIDRRRIVLGHA